MYYIYVVILYLHILDDEISDGHSDTKATVEAEIPTELDSVRVNEENVHEGVAKCSEVSITEL